MNQNSDTILGMFNMFSGGAFSRATIFALGIQPYINTSIIMQLLTIGIPALERMVKEGGEEGRKKIAAITRYATVILGALMGFGYYSTIRSYGFVTDRSFWVALVIIISFSAGSAFIMWLGEQITEFGIGNGISIVLFAGIVARGPSAIFSTARAVFVGKTISPLEAVAILALVLALVGFIVFITNSERRITVQYAKRVVGRKVYGGQSTHLPLKVNMTGVMPIIFAQAIASFPATIGLFANPAEGSFFDKLLNALAPGSVIYTVAYVLLIVFFSYFYTTMQFNPVEVANNLKKNGGFVPGFRPGKPTSDFIRKVLNKITLFGALFLGVVAVLPIILSNVTQVTGLALGGTSVLIVVGVALETVKSMESQMLMRHYKGFLE